MFCCARSECTVEGHAVVMHIVQACVVDHGLHRDAPVCVCTINENGTEVTIRWMNTWKVLHTVVLRHTPTRAHSVWAGEMLEQAQNTWRSGVCSRRTRTRAWSCLVADSSPRLIALVGPSTPLEALHVHASQVQCSDIRMAVSHTGCDCGCAACGGEGEDENTAHKAHLCTARNRLFVIAWPRTTGKKCSFVRLIRRPAQFSQLCSSIRSTIYA